VLELLAAHDPLGLRNRGAVKDCGNSERGKPPLFAGVVDEADHHVGLLGEWEVGALATRARLLVCQVRLPLVVGPVERLTTHRDRRQAGKQRDLRTCSHGSLLALERRLRPTGHEKRASGEHQSADHSERNQAPGTVRAGLTRRVSSRYQSRLSMPTPAHRQERSAT
jgi:hypothetical protein